MAPSADLVCNATEFVNSPTSTGLVLRSAASLPITAAVREQLVAQLRGLLRDVGAQALRQLLISAADPKRSGPAAAIGTVALILGATSVFAELQSALNRIWKTDAAPRPTGLWSLIRARLLSLGMFLGIGFLLAVSLILSAALHALSLWWSPLFGGWTLTMQIVNGAFSFAISTALFEIGKQQDDRNGYAQQSKQQPASHVRSPLLWMVNPGIHDER